MIEATVHVYSATANFLDLFVASDVSGAWTLLATLQPEAQGVQTLRASYTLPAGVLQAVRGVFRYGGSPAPCPTGAYDEADDLVFSTDVTRRSTR